MMQICVRISFNVSRVPFLSQSSNSTRNLPGLTEAPKKRAVLLDITCDSDGALEHYVDGQGIESTLPVPEYSADKPYLMGFFLVGAYQEILGDLHNLFGDTDSVHVELNDDGYVLTNAIKGDSVKDVLKFVDYDSAILAQNFELLVNKLAVSEQCKAGYLAELNAGLEGYTYFED